jgi:hypothetical protein
MKLLIQNEFPINDENDIKIEIYNENNKLFAKLIEYNAYHILEFTKKDAILIFINSITNNWESVEYYWIFKNDIITKIEHIEIKNLINVVINMKYVGYCSFINDDDEESDAESTAAQDVESTATSDEECDVESDEESTTQSENNAESCNTKDIFPVIPIVLPIKKESPLIAIPVVASSTKKEYDYFDENDKTSHSEFNDIYDDTCEQKSYLLYYNNVEWHTVHGIDVNDAAKKAKMYIYNINKSNKFEFSLKEIIDENFYKMYIFNVNNDDLKCTGTSTKSNEVQGPIDKLLGFFNYL